MAIETFYCAKTDIGLKRHRNEDCFCANHELGLYVVCDGMGGENAGEVASTLAVNSIQAYMADTACHSDLPFIGPYDATASPDWMVRTLRCRAHRSPRVAVFNQPDTEDEESSRQGRGCQHAAGTQERRPDRGGGRHTLVLPHALLENPATVAFRD